MGWRIALNERADLDLEHVVAFLARKNPVAAERLGLKLVETIFSLQEMPFPGAAVRGRPGYGRILHQPWFLIFYSGRLIAVTLIGSSLVRLSMPFFSL